MGFEFVEGITSDVMFKAWGKTLEEMFVQAALALLNVMYDSQEVVDTPVEEADEVEITVEGQNRESLLYRWLSEVIIEFEVTTILFTTFQVRIDQTTETNLVLRAKLKGKYSEDCGCAITTVVKGVTYYEFKIEETARGIEATIVVDI